MACILVPMTEAIITTITAKVVESKEEKTIQDLNCAEDTGSMEKMPFSRKLKWLNNMLWGGSGLLVFEHIWHGEIVPWFPFLTAASNAADTSAMLNEMATVGVGMSIIVTAVWLAMVGITSAMEKKALKEQPPEETA